MPRYRAHIAFHDDLGKEHTETIEFDSPSDNADDIAAAAQEHFRGFQQFGEERLPHNIRWEKLSD